MPGFDPAATRGTLGTIWDERRALVYLSFENLPGEISV